jgi:hypothetical protein
VNLHSGFENMGQFVTLKKKVQNMGCKKQGAKDRVIVSQKEKSSLLSSLFATHILDLFLTF